MNSGIHNIEKKFFEIRIKLDTCAWSNLRKDNGFSEDFILLNPSS